MILISLLFRDIDDEDDVEGLAAVKELLNVTNYIFIHNSYLNRLSGFW